MDVREEKDTDHDDVRTVVEAAFGRPSEATLVDSLRRDGDARISLVAISGGDIIGHIMLSTMTAPIRALGLAPVSVMPNHQGKGTGSRLIRESLRLAKDGNWEAVFLLGEPEFYARFGFRTDIASTFASPYAGPYFMALELAQGALKGKSGDLAYASAFASL
ncbi:MAG: GNAT family N-acetyltransferase [Alphaproteobacteria bacterium]